MLCYQRAVEELRLCFWCEIDRPLADFYVDKTRTSGLDNVCKPCRRQKRRERWAVNLNGQRDKAAANYARQAESFRYQQFVQRLRRVYRISDEQYFALLAEQGGRCALCREVEVKIHHNSGAVMRLAIDHDHDCCPSNRRTCGRCIRGLLCYECNLLIGKVTKRPELVKRFSDYLSRRPFKNATLL